MKWSALSLVSFVFSAFASPLHPTSRSTRLDLYTLRISTRSSKTLDGQYLGLKNSTVGVYQDSSALRIYPTTSDSSGNVELHVYPNGVVDHALALRGGSAQLDFLEVADPAMSTDALSEPDTRKNNPGEDLDWRSFVLNAEPQTAGKPANCLGYSAKDGRWVVVPFGVDGEWSVKFQTDDGIFAEDYVPIDITYEKVTSV
ncbi:hypothetical protein VTK73DRAFT_9495 [Phialemonium thermophilum]|uniref:Uncharacterized protein n=1 Tax=Phialemonium thermophilum TaxID=223376 RepID=A0ABR3Y4Z4_9PEZI